MRVRGGTIVTADESFIGDVDVIGERISAVVRASDGPTERAPAHREIDATGVYVLPGAVDVHTHTRVPSDASPDRFYDDSVGAALGGTTTFLSFNNPGTGISRAAQRTLRAGIEEWFAATAGESAVDYGLSGVITAQQVRPEDDIAWAVHQGVATFKCFFVYDFGVDARRLGELLTVTHANDGLLQVHGEDRQMLSDGIAAQLRMGHTQPRYHRDSRPPAVEAAGTQEAIEVAAAVGAPVYFVHVSSTAAVDVIARARAKGQPVLAETCPQYLVLDESVYEAPDAEATRYVISPPLRSKSDQETLWAALTDGRLDLIATDSVPDRLDVEKVYTGQSFDNISNGAPGISTLLPMVWGSGVATGRLTPEQAVNLISTMPARIFRLPNKGAIEVGRDADLVLLDPNERWTMRASDLHQSSDFTNYEGMEIQGGVRHTLVRGKPVVQDGAFVGARGQGTPQHRSIT